MKSAGCGRGFVPPSSDRCPTRGYSPAVTLARFQNAGWDDVGSHAPRPAYVIYLLTFAVINLKKVKNGIIEIKNYTLSQENVGVFDLSDFLHQPAKKC